ncbi:PREDICTED: thioredoxin [Prunus dulcis]|uniref:PREDICTED: thioredoxin n=1 Tax=Prunus dulcis TaxID=3755 RepID=A0A5E4EHQ9_PRUDU|nr:PREDICTED: thioredoxin [Prunus dulcis]
MARNSVVLIRQLLGNRNHPCAAGRSNLFVIESLSIYYDALDKVTDKRMSAVFFYTAPFCRATYQWITPIFDELREQFPHITMFKVIMEQNRPGPTVDVFGVHRNMNTGSTLDELGIQETPTFHCYLKLERVHEVAGISARHLKKRLENVYKENLGGFSLGWASPKPSAVKPVPHLLLELQHILINRLVVRDLMRHVVDLQPAIETHLVELELRPVEAARAVAMPGLQQPLLDVPLAPLLLQDAPADPRRHLVDHQDEEVDEPARAAAADGGALGGGAAGDFRQSNSAVGDLGPEQRLPAVAGDLPEKELPR